MAEDLPATNSAFENGEKFANSEIEDAAKGKLWPENFDRLLSAGEKGLNSRESTTWKVLNPRSRE